jgi:hypothetical protein
MKNLLLAVVLSLVSLTSFGQLIINQEVTNTKPYRVGDTLTVRYNVIKGTTNPRYLWMRYQYSNKHLQKLGPTVFSQGTTAQNFEATWPNYMFTQNPAIGVGELDKQYASTPWNYTQNNDWIAKQFTTQRADAVIDGLWATEKFILLENSTYQGIHKLDLATATGTNDAAIVPIGSQVLQLSFADADVKHVAAFRVKVGYPTNFPITSLSVQIQPLNTDGTTNWTIAPLAKKALNSAGTADFEQFNIGDKFGVYIVPDMGAAYLNDVVTVTDAYRAFLAVTDVGLNGTSSVFQYPAIEKVIGNVTLGDGDFNTNDAYYLFAHILGQDVSTKASIPKQNTTSLRFVSVKQSAYPTITAAQSNNVVTIATANQTEVFSYAFGGDLDFSHSSNPGSPIAANSAVGTNSTMNRTIANSGIYANQLAGTATLSLSSKIENNKVILSGNLSQEGLAGLEVIMRYDSSKLTLDGITFDAGSTVTNFSTNKDGRLTFGSMDQIKTGRIKTGTPYKLTFTSNVPLTNTAGLFYTELADAVDGKGNKIGLNVE